MIVHNRKPNRLKNYEYSQAGSYLVTISTQNRVNYFGVIVKAQMKLNDIGRIAKDCWQAIPRRFSDIGLDEFVVMPNHIHGIIVIKGDHFLRDNGDGLENNDRCSLRNSCNMQLLPKIVSQYKSSVTRLIRKRWNNHSCGWQKSFYDHIIRNDQDLYHIRAYIRDNPLDWELEKNNRTNWNG